MFGIGNAFNDRKGICKIPFGSPSFPLPISPLRRIRRFARHATHLERVAVDHRNVAGIEEHRMVGNDIEHFFVGMRISRSRVGKVRGTTIHCPFGIFAACSRRYFWMSAKEWSWGSGARYSLNPADSACRCESIRPGSTVRPCRSISRVRAPRSCFRMTADFLISTIRSPCIAIAS